MAGRKSSNVCSGVVICRPYARRLRFLAPGGLLILTLAILSSGVLPVHAGDEPGGALSGDGSRGQGRFARRDKGSDRGSLETRIESREGVFVVYDAAAVADVEEEFVGYLAYWDDFETGTLFLYGRLLFDRLDVGQALENLQRDLAVDLVTFRTKNFMLDSALSEAAVENPDATQWHPATRNLIRELVGCSGPSVGAGDSDGVLCRQYPCYSTAPPAPPPNDSSKPPDPRRPPEAEPAPIVTPWPCDAVDQSLRIACACGGGGPPLCYSAADCNDRDDCTTDSCIEWVCEYTKRFGSCEEDGNPCTKGICDIGSCIGERPAPGLPCAGDGKACTHDVCDSTGACVHPPNDAYCDNGNPCTFDYCEWQTGACLHLPNNGPCTDDGNPCTDDVCSNESCTHPPNSSPCDDGDLCTEDDVCSGGACGGVDVVCPGGQQCDPADGVCKNCLTAADCDDGNPCSNDACNAGTCDHRDNTGSCNDGDLCTQNDACSGGVCAGTAIGCDDNNACTDDGCDGGVCLNIPTSVPCDDGDSCTLGDTCVTGGCEGTPITCNDGNICTDDACVYGICSYTPNGNPGCESGPCPGGCKDGNQCTVDSCDDNTCTHTTHSGSCEDGYSCTENDTCSNGVCVGTPMDCDDGDPCTYDWCDGTEPLRPGGAAALLKGKCVHDSLCEDSECCKPPCTACQDNGWLTIVNPTITVSPATVCLGDTITFDFIGVVEDVGGIMRVDCVMKTEISGVTPTYTWRITKPDGTTEPPSSDPPGSGTTATVLANLPGDYHCDFEATVKRQCPPDSITIGPETAEAIELEITTPNGDPTTSAGANATNERTYSSAAVDPTVTVPCAASGVPDPTLLRWTIDDVGGIRATWSPSVPGDPYTGTGISPTATFTGLPPNYNDFGAKTITLSVDGQPNCQDTQVVEIFFGKDNTNNPGGADPNWYYYWSQALGVSGNHTYNGARSTSNTAVTSATSWTIEIGLNASWPGGNPPTGQTYINGFWATNLHESWHRDHRVHNFLVHGAWSPPAPEDVDGDGICDREPGDPAGHSGGWEATIGTDPNVANSTEAGGNWAESNGVYGHQSKDWASPGSQF